MNRSQNSKRQNEYKERLAVRMLEFLVRLMVPARVREEFLGDLLEEWSTYVVPRFGRLRALSWLCSQLFRSLIPMARVWVRGFFFGDNAMFQRQNVPTSLKMVAAVCLVFVVLNLACVVFVIAISQHEYAPLHATGGLFKVILYTAMTVGLFNLSEGWRKFLVFFSGYCVLVIPILFSTFAISPDVFREFAEISVVQSRVAVELILAILFPVFLWMFITLRRPDVKRAFELGGQETIAT